MCMQYDYTDMGNYDLTHYDPHDTITLLYDADINRFIDASFGHIIHDIFRYLSPSQIFIFKNDPEQCDWITPDVTNSFLIELVHADLY